MSPSAAFTKHVVQANRGELILHAVTVIVVVICATVLGLHNDFNSGDLLAVFTGVITGTASVASARAGNNNRRVRTGEDNQ